MFSHSPTYIWDPSLRRNPSTMLPSAIAQEQSIPLAELQYLITEYLYTQKLPHDQDIVDSLPEPPKILERQGIIDRIKQAIQDIVEVFEW